MMRLIIFLFILMISFSAQTQLTIKLNKIPFDTPENATIFIAGTMNNWNPGNTNFKLTKDSFDTYRITFTPAIGNIKFKFTRGSWETVEGTAQGGYIPDRILNYSGQPKIVELTIAGWEGVNNIVSTASPQVSILSDSFQIPQLNRKRKIWVYLPKDYHTAQSRYPVLYMHDAQNLFDIKTSFSGEWRIDESLDSMNIAGDPGCIVIGIENGGSLRLNEYSPWVNTQYGGGEGDEYTAFIVETLKPYIDANFRTLTDNENTGIMGSSMGGLISTYAGIAYPEVFGKVGAFSSAYWFSEESYLQPVNTKVNEESYFYMIAGAQEGGNQVGDMDRMASVLKSNGAKTINVNANSHLDGKHSEWYWAREFPKAYKWMFEKKTSGVSEEQINSFKVYQAEQSLFFVTDIDIDKNVVDLIDLNGNVIFSGFINNHQVELNSDYLFDGLYVVRIRSGRIGHVNLIYLR
ncbi:MAG: alpha/beta hydrolase [Saprospiraceae bacterium]|nr:alpha/beta hydrolase [Saprospiraceae bacterium]